jgi:uncharacterized membrane protein
MAVAGLFAWKRHRRWHAMAGCGGRWHSGWHGRAHHGRHWHGPGRWRGPEYWILAELDCTPAQERLVREELRGLVDQVRGLRDERQATRDDLARAIAGDQLDRAALMTMFSRHDQRLVELRANITASLERVHGSLDAGQRERLAALVRGSLGGHGSHGPGPFGPYR